MFKTTQKVQYFTSWIANGHSILHFIIHIIDNVQNIFGCNLDVQPVCYTGHDLWVKTPLCLLATSINTNQSVGHICLNLNFGKISHRFTCHFTNTDKIQNYLISYVKNYFTWKICWSATFYSSWSNFKWVIFIKYTVKYAVCNGRASGCCQTESGSSYLFWYKLDFLPFPLCVM